MALQLIKCVHYLDEKQLFFTARVKILPRKDDVVEYVNRKQEIHRFRVIAVKHIFHESNLSSSINNVTVNLSPL